MESKVSEILEAKGKEIFSVTPDITAFEAVNLMAEKNIGALLVMAGEQLAGIATERDYARKIILKELSVKETAVKQVMTTKVASTSPDVTLAEAMVIMTQNRCRHLPVFDNNNLVGIVSIGNIAERLIEDQAATIKELNEYIAGNWEQEKKSFAIGHPAYNSVQFTKEKIHIGANFPGMILASYLF